MEDSASGPLRIAPESDEIDRHGRDSHNQQTSGVSSAVERELPKLDVTGSIPVPRSISSRLAFNQLPSFFPQPEIVIRITKNRDVGHLPFIPYR